MNDKFRKIVREMIEDELEEISATGAVAGYQTPYAFGKRKPVGDKKVDHEVLPFGESTDPLNTDDVVEEAATRYHAFKSDPLRNEVQKIGTTIQEITRQINEMHRAVRMATRLKTETKTPHDKLWKRTAKHIGKMEAKLEEIRNCLRELRG